MKALCVFGTRPEAIKFASVIQALRETDGAVPVVCCTAQHRQMLDQVLKIFDIRVNFDLEAMRQDQDLFHTTIAVLRGLQRVIAAVKPDWLVVQGDATTAFAGAVSGYYAQVPVAHIEAGLRTYSKFAPYPEELNRHAIAVFSDAHFAPTNWARDNLLREGIRSDRIWVTGNTSIDALYSVVRRIEDNHVLRTQMEKRFSFLSPRKRTILVTAHRRESFGPTFETICLALRDIALLNDTQIVYPVHMNPHVREPVERLLGPVGKAAEVAEPISNLFLMEPLDYASLVYLLKRVFLVLTDSGGLQEEAPTLGKPVLIMRDTTERPEGVTAGVARLVGRSRSSIVESVSKLLHDPLVFSAMAKPTGLYGDGHAGERIVAVLRNSAIWT
jgi:UDP-N-acetylglucosamine 2-epimerase (non-hydrolysing)